MAEERKKMNRNMIAAICASMVAVVVIIVVIIINVTRPTVIGKYVLYATVDSEGNESTSMVDLMKAFGGKETIEFRSDKTGVIEVVAEGGLFGSVAESEDEDDDPIPAVKSSVVANFTYDDKKINATNDAGGFESEYTYKDDVVTVTISGENMRFKREGK